MMMNLSMVVIIIGMVEFCIKFWVVSFFELFKADHPLKVDDQLDHPPDVVHLDDDLPVHGNHDVAKKDHEPVVRSSKFK